MAWYKARGYVAIHNTHGSFDVMAAKPGDLRVVEVKGTKERYGSFNPADRVETCEAAIAAGAMAYLWWKPKYAREPEEIPSYEWP